MNIEQVLAEFGRDYGFGQITLNAANMTRLEFQNGLTVDFEYREQNGLYLYGVVAAVERKPAVALLQALLEANAPAHNCDGFVFSIDSA
ncbi:MAG: type III secretion system chaperone, partial [Candidatus Hydrogenedentes bacterium]|nr:type III secretion system chaperone [Candidatus Hydrogenedentota bacterium]